MNYRYNGNGQPPGGVEAIQDPEDYAQRRQVEKLMDASEMVLDRREAAYEHFWNGRINHSDYLKAIRMAVERYLSISKQAVKSHRWAQWYWNGQPPTVDGSPSYEFNEDTGKWDLVAYPPDKVLPTTAGDEITAIEAAESPRYNLDAPVLAVDDAGDLPFGDDLNILGKLLTGKEDDPQTEEFYFIGLRSVKTAPDPIVIEKDSLREHPQKLRTMEKEKETYQIPEDVLMAAYDLLNDFWQYERGVGFQTRDRKTIIKNFDPSREQAGEVDTTDISGAPEL